MEPLGELAKRFVSSLQGAAFFPFNKWRAVRLADNPPLLMPEDTAFVLGQEPSFGVSAFYACRETILPEGVYLLGDDLTSLGPQTSFARIVFVKLRNFFSYAKPAAFERIKAIKDMESGLMMEGIMVNESKFEKQETIAFRRGGAFARLSFEALGDDYVNLFKTNSDVDKVAVVFVTLPTFDYAEAKRQAVLADKTLDAMVFLGGKKEADCGSCPQRALCEAVPGLRETHLSRLKKGL